MIKMDIQVTGNRGGHCNVEYDSTETLRILASEILDGMDLIISEKVLSKKGLSEVENLRRAHEVRNQLLEIMKTMPFNYPECYMDKELLIMEDEVELKEGADIFFIVLDGKELVVEKGKYVPGFTEEQEGELGKGFFLSEADAYLELAERTHKI